MERLFNIIRLPKRPLYKFLIMKVYFVFLLFIITNSCSEKNIGQLSSTDVASNNKNTNDVIPSQSQNPGEICSNATDTHLSVLRYQILE